MKTLSRLFKSLLILLGIINPLEYKQRKMTDEERTAEYRQLNLEIDDFLKQIGKRFPHQWSLGEMIWYESIRCREATL